MAALIAAENAQDELFAGDQRSVGVAQLLSEIAHELTEVGLGALACGFELFKARHGAAQADDSADLVGNIATAGVRGFGHMTGNGGVGCCDAAVAVCSGIFLGSRLNAPDLAVPAEWESADLSPQPCSLYGVWAALRLEMVSAAPRSAMPGAAVSDGQVDKVVKLRHAEEHFAHLGRRWR